MSRVRYRQHIYTYIYTCIYIYIYIYDSKNHAIGYNSAYMSYIWIIEVGIERNLVGYDIVGGCI